MTEDQQNWKELAQTMMEINKKTRGKVQHCSYKTFAYISLLVKSSLMVKSVGPLL